MELQRKLPLFIAIACGILAILLLNIYLSRRETEMWEKLKEQVQPVVQPQPQPQLKAVLVAGRDIDPQTPITHQDLMIREVPVDYIQPGAITSLDRIIGQVSSLPISRGQQILQANLQPAAEIKLSLSEIIRDGKRAVTISMDTISAQTGLIRPGDVVDVFALMTLPAEISLPAARELEGRQRLVSLFQGVEVLAIDGEFTPSAREADRTARRTTAATLSGTATLLLDPQEAILLAFIQEHAKIKLALRSREDLGVERVEEVNWDALFQYLYPDVEVKKRRGSTVEIYRGLRKETLPLSSRKE